MKGRVFQTLFFLCLCHKYHQCSRGGLRPLTTDLLYYQRTKNSSPGLMSPCVQTRDRPDLRIVHSGGPSPKYTVRLYGSALKHFSVEPAVDCLPQSSQRLARFPGVSPALWSVLAGTFKTKTWKIKKMKPSFICTQLSDSRANLHSVRRGRRSDPQAISGVCDLSETFLSAALRLPVHPRSVCVIPLFFHSL